MASGQLGPARSKMYRSFDPGRCRPGVVHSNRPLTTTAGEECLTVHLTIPRDLVYKRGGTLFACPRILRILAGRAHPVWLRFSLRPLRGTVCGGSVERG